MNELELQKTLAELGFDPGPVDGIMGARTRAAIRKFQESRNLAADGIVGSKTRAALQSAMNTSDRDDVAPAGTAWPHQNDVTSFFGRAGGPDCTSGRCYLPFPFVIAWDTDQQISSFSCHRLVAKPLTALFAEAAEHYGEAKFKELRLHYFGGCYNYRAMRGSSRLSMHSWGMAVDIDPERNAFRQTGATASLAKPEVAPFWDIVEKHGGVSLGRHSNTDWMHFQFARFR